MNDFTKEELIRITIIVTEFYNEPGLFCGDEKIVDKLQSLVGSYCEHKTTHAHTMNVQVCDNKDCMAII